MYDIYIALEWISWRLSPIARRRSQEYIDRAAKIVLQEAAKSPHTSEAIKELAKNCCIKVEQKPLEGIADDTCNTLCKTILRTANEDDFLRMLSAHPKKISEWRKIWDAFRAEKPKIRRI